MPAPRENTGAVALPPFGSSRLTLISSKPREVAAMDGCPGAPHHELLRLVGACEEGAARRERVDRHLLRKLQVRREATGVRLAASREAVPWQVGQTRREGVAHERVGRDHRGVAHERVGRGWRRDLARMRMRMRLRWLNTIDGE